MAIFNSYVTNYYQRVANLIKPNLGDRDYSAGCPTSRDQLGQVSTKKNSPAWMEFIEKFHGCFNAENMFVFFLTRLLLPSGK